MPAIISRISYLCTCSLRAEKSELPGSPFVRMTDGGNFVLQWTFFKPHMVVRHCVAFCYLGRNITKYSDQYSLVPHA